MLKVVKESTAVNVLPGGEVNLSGAQGSVPGILAPSLRLKTLMLSLFSLKSAPM